VPFLAVHGAHAGSPRIAPVAGQGGTQDLLEFLQGDLPAVIATAEGGVEERILDVGILQLVKQFLSS
jgi:hypothetical protein